jgi:spore coat-associated protein N
VLAQFAIWDADISPTRVMTSFSVSRLLSLAAIVAVAAVCAGAGAARPERPAQVVITQASGELELSNSANGQAIFQAGGLAPGGSVTGTVRLTNSGTLPGDLSLQQLDVSDQPGPGGGRLSDVVTLQVADITGGSSIPVFAGPLKALASRPLGAIGPGESRTFRFTATLPDSGNAFAGSGLTVRYAWNASASGGGPGPSEQPVANFKLNSKKLLTRRFLDVTATCNIACRISARAELPKAKRGKKALKSRTRSALLGTPNKPARIRLKLSRKAQRALRAVVKKKHRAVVKVRLGVSAAEGGPSVPYTKKATVKAARRRAARH